MTKIAGKSSVGCHFCKLLWIESFLSNIKVAVTSIGGMYVTYVHICYNTDDRNRSRNLHAVLLLTVTVLLLHEPITTARLMVITTVLYTQGFQ